MKQNLGFEFLAFQPQQNLGRGLCAQNKNNRKKKKKKKNGLNALLFLLVFKTLTLG